MTAQWNELDEKSFSQTIKKYKHRKHAYMYLYAMVAYIEDNLEEEDVVRGIKYMHDVFYRTTYSEDNGNEDNGKDDESETKKNYPVAYIEADFLDILRIDNMLISKNKFLRDPAPGKRQGKGKIKYKINYPQK